MTIFDLFHSSSSRTHWRLTSNLTSVEGHDASRAVTAHAVDRLALYRKAFRAAGLLCPVEFLRQPGVQAMVRKHGLAVDVRSCDELAFAMSVGIPPARIVLQDDGRTAAPIRCGVNAGVGRIVMACPEQIKVLASCLPRTRRTQRILADLTPDATNVADATIDSVLANRQLDLIGVHARLTPGSDLTDYAVVAAEMILRLSRIRREHDVILTNVSLAGGDVLADPNVELVDLRALARVLDDIIDDVCSRVRFPRPTLILTPW